MLTQTFPRSACMMSPLAAPLTWRLQVAVAQGGVPQRPLLAFFCCHVCLVLQLSGGEPCVG